MTTLDTVQRHELPMGWKWRKLGEICDVTDRDHRTPSYQEHGVPLISPKDFTEHGVDLSRLKQVAPEELTAFVKKCKPEIGDILYSRIGTIGEARLVDFDLDFVALHSIAMVKPRLPGLMSKFVLYLLQSPAIRSKAKHNIKSVGTPDLGLTRIRDFDVPVPPTEVQKVIVAEIEKQFSRLDEAVANLQRVKANLKRYKAAVLKAAVEGRLVETEAELARRDGRSYETGEQLLQRILEERRAKWAGKGKYKEPLPLASDSIGTAPEGWAWAAVEMVCESIVDCPHSTAKFQANGYPCVDTTWMTTEGLIVERARYVDEATYLDRISRLAPKSGDIVFAREGTIGTAVLIPDRMTPCLGQRVMLLRASTEYLNGFLVHVLHSEVVKAQYRAQALGSTVAHINVGDVKRFAVPVPPLTEQVRILAEVDRHLSIIREVEIEVDANLQRAQALRQATLARAFSTEG